jgi:hypothetical protein
MIINPYFFEQPLLLDLYPNAATAYSVRKLRTAYTGNCIRVRRSSDNAEQNIGFVNNELDTTSLLSFVGAGNGFVTTWYDQSGNGFDVTQTTAANQPRIVSSGVLELQNSKPTLYFDGTNDHLINNNVNILNNKNKFMSFVAHKWVTTPIITARVVVNVLTTGVVVARFGLNGLTSNLYQTGGRRLTSDSFKSLFSINTFNVSVMNNTLSVLDFTNTDAFIYINNNLDNSELNFLTSGNTQAINSIITIGASTTVTNAGNLNISEIVQYEYISNELNINTNIQTYFGI